MLRTAMRKPLPLADETLDQLFAGLASYRLLLLAVSGGADSVALMHLIARWQPRFAPACAIHVATVDHGLRDGSLAEARAVARAAGDLRLPHRVLSWTGPKPSSGRQQAARDARYALLSAELARLGEANAALVTAHTADDQAETLLMRLSRGSGLDGLSAMRECRPLTGTGSLHLCRPLLAVTKDRLLATLDACGVRWSEDPSNTDPAFERVRLRAAASALAEIGLSADKIALSALRLQRARSALEWASAAFETRVLDLHGGVFAAIDRAQFSAAPAELRVRLLARVLARFGGAAPVARLSRIEALVQRLAGESPVTVTLGGCVVACSPSHIHVSREPGRRGLPACTVHAGEPQRWDERFMVAADVPRRRPVEVRALGTAGYATLRRALQQPLPARVAATLPAFWRGGELIAVPLLRVPPEVLPAQTGAFRTEFLGLPDDPHISDESSHPLRGNDGTP